MKPIDADELIEHAWRDRLDSRELIAEMIKKAPPIQAIPIPDNATNGDIIKLMFPYITEENNTNKYLGINFDTESRVGMLKEWWNAPYKRSDTK